MKNENEFKTAFKKSVKAQGGFSISLAAPMLVGIPDLYVIMPGYMPILLEAKWIGEVNYKFKRKIQYTEMQKHWINECCEVKRYSAMGLVGLKLNKFYYAFLLEAGKGDNYLDDNAFTQAASSIYGGDPGIPKIFNVSFMFDTANIPKMNGISNIRMRHYDIQSGSLLTSEPGPDMLGQIGDMSKVVYKD